ncbi:BamA/TamA family outer membrane protein [Neolewinella aurantiaca]|uniref:BamA/TamA family outer membrane protein n=1 Tax=Neolewinella aurantiaca TaxID=2602767 RepID=A0A5C7FVP5_9BACT|nr:BamA/TamA family outer membrane protein [Neolewinella aurantiaca]TXF89667.1 BamA/TamA family outer membrane protein [Neolewinella aurantiaca]
MKSVPGKPLFAPALRRPGFGLARTFVNAIAFCGIMIWLSSCSVSKYIPEGEYLYRGAAVNIEAPEGVDVAELTTEVNATLNNNTNNKNFILGYYQIWRWYRWQEKAAEKPEKYEDKDPKGTAPIFYNEALVESVNTLMENRASNNGYFNNEADFTLDTLTDPPEISADYTLTVGRPYTIDSLRRFWTDSSVSRIVEASLAEKTLLKRGARYDLDLIKAERQRWETQLRNAGYYYARADDFVFLADTVGGDHQVNMLLKLKDDTPPSHLYPQRISAINVYPNVNPRDTTRRFLADTVKIGGLNVLCDDCPLRPKIVDEAFAQESGDLYSPVEHDKTLRRLVNYNTFRYISMSYDPLPGTDSLLTLNATMQPRLQRRFEGEFGLTYNNARYFGPNVHLAYINRNLLKGAELLRLEGDFSYAISSGSDVRVPRSGIYGLTATLEVPRLWMPKRRKIIPRVMTSGTVISLGGKMENLSLRLSGFSSEIATNQLDELSAQVEEDPDAMESISLIQLSGKFGYTWRRRIAKSHALYPINIRFQDPRVSTPQLLDLARELGVAPGAENGASRFDRMIVFSPNYILTYDDRKKGLKTHNLFWQQSVAMSFNTIFPVGTQAEFLDSERSIYPQLETDLRYYLTFNKRQQFAARLHVGAAVPITERAIVPYFDLYSIGGPNSLRGFSPRELGPGRSAPQGANLLSSGGYGNVIFETSFEFRQRLNSMIEIAPFFDAGNIWTYKTETEPLNTDFTTSTFLDELAFDAGLGFRFDLQFLILRVDIAKPLRVPYEDPLSDQVPPYQDAGEVPDKSLRFVLAFGYPF